MTLIRGGLSYSPCKTPGGSHNESTLEAVVQEVAGQIQKAGLWYLDGEITT